MRTWLIGIWLLVPPAFAVWHFGPGQERLRADDAAGSIRAARQAASAGDWESAVAAYDAALNQLPEGRADEARRVRLARAVAKLRGKTLAKGREELVDLVAELEREPGRDPEALNSARSALAYSRFHTCWLMRLEGRSRLEWEPEVEAARQGFRASVEQALALGDTATAGRLQEDLESAVRLARMDLADLQAKNLPEEMQGSGSGEGEGEGKEKGKGKGKGRGKGKGEGEGEGEGEGTGLGQGKNAAKDARGASSGPPPDTGGH